MKQRHLEWALFFAGVVTGMVLSTIVYPILYNMF